MRKKKTLHSVFLLLQHGISLFFFLVAAAVSVIGQEVAWSDIPASSLQPRKAGLLSPSGFRALSLDPVSMKNFLLTVPHESVTSIRQSDLIIPLPMPDGSMQRFRVVESPVMERGLAEKFPEIKTFLAQAVDNPAVVARFDWTTLGFHALIIRPGGYVLIEPNNLDNSHQYISFNQKDLPVPEDLKLCSMQDSKGTTIDGQDPLPDIPIGSQLRTYRLAVAATGQYTAQYGGNAATALAAITTVVNQVTLIYEVEVSVRFALIANNINIVYTDSTTDPFTDVWTNPCSSNIRAENQAAIDGAIGAANYDIGHVFTGTNIGGCAAGSVVCAANKAWGASGVRLGSAFDVGLTSHEIGHQFSAGHTFNSDNGSCAGAQYSPTTAYEPASGTTIMSYAGGCHDIQGFRDMVFHTISYQQIVTFSTVGGGNACANTSNTGNTPPTVNAGAGGFVIPINTPFTLTGSGNDPDGDPLTFSWEEFDLGPQGPPNNPTGTAPIFRSFPPVNNPSRTFPQLSDILNNTQTLGEILPSYGRALNFRLTARDNRLNGGGVEYASMGFTVDGTKGPLAVTSHNSFVALCPGPTTVTWSVNSTDDLSANVNILLSYDGGQTFPVTLVSNTPNDGSQSVNIPCTFSNMARIKVEAASNVFFDISNANIRVGDNTDPSFTVPANVTINKDANCNYNASTAITGDVTDEDDNCDNTLNATYADATAPGTCDGETILTRTWTLTDDCGNSTVKVQTITITDITPPTFTDPADITIYKDENCEHDASVGVTGDVTDEADNCDNTLNATFSDVVAPGSCIGELIITRTWSLTDDCGNNLSKDQVITVRDTTRPDLSNIYPNPAVLWPPNHKMRDVTINYTAVDNCSPVTNVLTVTSNEPINGTGDGNTSPDWIVVDDHHVQLRAERAGNGNGRTYTIKITSTDDCGNVAEAYTYVYVPHNNSMNIYTIIPAEQASSGLSVKALPNPSSVNFAVTVSSDNNVERIMISVFDMHGRRIEDRLVKNGMTISLGSNYRAGTYILRVIQGKENKEYKLIKLN